MTIEALTDALGLSWDGSDVARNGVSVPIAFDAESLDGRIRNAALGMGARIGIDRVTSTYDFSDERPSGNERARNIYEQPMMYGERLQYLAPQAAIDKAEEISGETFVRLPWVDDDLCVVMLREVGKEWHVFAHSDFSRVDFDQENLTTNARLSLFYQNYKPKPRETKESWGRMREYSTVHGITMASRCILFPDYDYDASAAGGVVSIVSRDCFLVAEPRPDAELSDVVATIQQRWSTLVDQALFPMSDKWYQLERTRILKGDRFTGEST